MSESKINMSLDDIIKKQRKTFKRGGAQGARGGRNPSAFRGNNRKFSNNSNRQLNKNTNRNFNANRGENRGRNTNNINVRGRGGIRGRGGFDNRRRLNNQRNTSTPQNKRVKNFLSAKFNFKVFIRKASLLIQIFSMLV